MNVLAREATRTANWDLSFSLGRAKEVDVSKCLSVTGDSGVAYCVLLGRICVEAN